MKKILIIGCPGAGKSTLARWLSAKTGLPLYHLDMIWHRPDRTTVTREEFDEKLAEILAGERWIIDGNYSRTLPRRLAAADAVLFLDLPVEACLAGATARIGKPRPDLPWQEQELDPDFRQWIIDFPKDKLPRIYALLEDTGVPVTVFHSHAEIEEYKRKFHI